LKKLRVTKKDKNRFNMGFLDPCYPFFHLPNLPTIFFHLPNGGLTICLEFIGQKQIGRIAWPARSQDLTPLDFFLWGHLKTVVYADPTINLWHLKQNITEACTRLTKDQIMAASQDEVKRCL